MKYARGAFALMLLLSGLPAAAPYDVSIGKQSNYNSWGTGWDSVYVIKNSIVTLAAVPKIGGRIMQYDLGTHASMYVDSANKGKIPATSVLVGGFRTLVSPQSSFPWPPSPILDVGPYSCSIVTNTADSGVIYLQSQIETTAGYPTLNGLQFKRTVTMYKASSHVNVSITMANKGTSTLPAHGIWDITEGICRNNNLLDTTNIWVYFPLNPASTLGGGKGYVQLQGADTTQWKRNVAAGGIMGVQYHRKEAKIGADSRAGWISYVDRLDGYAFVKRFTYETGKTYPDSNTSVQVYTCGSTNFLEWEVLGPLASLAPNDSLRMAEDWFAARSFGPVLAVNNAGLITKKLTAQQSHDTVRAQGVYGVFYQGNVKSVFETAAGTTVAVADSYAVSPLDSFTFNDTLKVPVNAVTLMLVLYNMNGVFVGNLDSIAVVPSAVFNPEQTKRGNGLDPDLKVYTKENVLSIDVPFESDYSVELTGLDGRLIGSFHGSKPHRYVVPKETMRPGVYLVKARCNGTTEYKKIVLQ